MSVSSLKYCTETCNVGYLIQPNSDNNKHQHGVTPVIECDSNKDTFVCKDKEQMKKALECAKKNGQCGGNLFYTPLKEGWWIFPDQKAVYKYICNGSDSARTIRDMFNLKDGALRKFDTHIFDVDRLYPKGHEIYFYEEDIKEWE